MPKTFGLSFDSVLSKVLIKEYMTINPLPKTKDIFILIEDKQTGKPKEVKCKGYPYEPEYWWDKDVYFLQDVVRNWGSLQSLSDKVKEAVAGKCMQLKYSPSFELKKNILFNEEELNFIRNCYKEYKPKGYK